MSNCVSPVLSYGELHYGYEYQICKGIFLQEKDPFHVCMDSGNYCGDSSCRGISWFFCRSVVVQEGSMEPTLVPGERVLMDSAWYRLSSPKRGDIIAFRTSEDKKASIHIKRVIALPGETVQIKDGQILINGEVYNEKDEFPAITNAGLASEPITVGKGQYFVLGDNRNNSEDSRHNGMGLVDSDRIVGKLWFTISPWKKIGFV